MSTRSELESKLSTFAAAQIPPLPIAFESQSFTPPSQTADNLWLECYLMPGPTISATVSADTNRERGIWCVNVWRPSNKGVGKLETVAEQIIKLFPVIPKTGTVSIEQPGSKSKINITADGWACISLTFQYRVESLA